MKISDHRLVGNDNRRVPFVKSGRDGSKKLSGGKPRFLVIHYTASGSGPGTVSFFKNTTKVSVHLVIGHDGEITQMLPFDRRGAHAGSSRWKDVNGLNSHSVGIEIVNWGILNRTGAGGWASWTGSSVPDNRVVMAEHKNHPGKVDGWEMFDNAQFQASVDAARVICEEYDIGPSDLVGHDDISPGRKVDPGPAFSMARFKSLVFGREDGVDEMMFAVRSSSGLNLREGPGVSHAKIELLADGAKVRVIETHGKWWTVSKIVNGEEDTTGFVHSNWLIPV